MDIESILIEAERIGKRKEVLERVSLYRSNSPYRRDISDLTSLYERALQEVRSGE